MFVILINSVLCIAVMAAMLYYGAPLIADIVPPQWARPISALITLLLCAPMLWMLMRSGSESPQIDKLWASGAHWRVRLTAYGLLRMLITAVFVSYIIDYALPWNGLLGIFALVAVMVAIFYSRYLGKQSRRLERNFRDNLNAREKMQSEQ